jgi:diphthamide biosynthesis protein 7
MSSSESSERALCSIDTELPANSVEFCPNEGYHEILVCGTYNLVKNEQSEADPDTASRSKLQERNGRCLVYEFDKSTQSL